MANAHEHVVTYRRDLAAAKANLAMLKAQQGKHEEAVKLETEAESILGDLLDKFPNQDVYRSDMGKLLVNRGNARTRLKEFKKAEDDYLNAIQILESFKETGSDAEKLIYFDAVSNLASLFSRQKDRLDDSESLYRTAIEAMTRLDNPRSSRSRATAINNLGNVLMLKQERDGALELFREAAQIQAELVQTFPAVAVFKKELVRSRLGLGRALMRLAKDGAEAELLEAQAMGDELVASYRNRPEFKKELASVFDQLGAFYRKADAQKAREMYRRGLELRGELSVEFPANPQYAFQATAAEINFANFLRLSQDYPAAIGRYESVQNKLSEGNPNPKLIRAVTFGLGDALVKSGEYARALPCWEQLVKNEKDPAWHAFELQRAICLVRTGAISEGVEAAEAILNKKQDGVILYDVACCYSVAVTMSESGANRERYGKRAVELLGLAGEKEFFDDAMRKHAATDGDLDALRSRTDFKQLVDKYKIRDSVDF